MAGMGLIGTALAGAAEGLGRSAAPLADFTSRSALAAQAEEVQKMRDARLADLQRDRDERLHGQAVAMEKEVKQPFQTAERVATQDFTSGENVKNREHAESLQERGFIHAEDMQAARQKFDEEQHKLNRDLTREQIAASRAIAAGNNNVAKEIAKLGGTPQTGKNGEVFFMDKEGKLTPVIDPNTNKQMVGNKDLTPAAKQYAEVLKAQLVDLDRMEIAAAGDAAQIKQIGERRSAYTRDLLNVLTGGISATANPKPAGDRPPLSAFGAKPGATQSTAPATNGGAAPEGPKPSADAGVSAYGPLTSWETVEKQVRAGDQAAIKYAKERIAKGPGIIGVTPPDSLIELLKDK